jgi:adenine-specific DNA-methyltransferase
MVKKNTFNELIKVQEVKNLERHLIYAYLKHHQIDYAESPVLVDYFIDFKQNKTLFSELSSFHILTLKELENHLEMMIPEADRKLNGAFFTPDFVIDFMINEIKPKIDDKNLDPSCGCGAFLVGLTDYYYRTFNKKIRDIVRNNIFGSDILAYNIDRAKLILSIYALQKGEILQNTDFNLWNQDSLKAEWEQEFDAVLGNPPYIKFQDLSEENRIYLANHWTTVEGGTFNLYFAFFELGYKLLKINGKLAYITPNNYFTSLAGESLRNYFQNKKCLSRIVDFSHKKVFSE